MRVLVRLRVRLRMRVRVRVRVRGRVRGRCVPVFLRLKCHQHPRRKALAQNV